MGFMGPPMPPPGLEVVEPQQADAGHDRQHGAIVLRPPAHALRQARRCQDALRKRQRDGQALLCAEHASRADASTAVAQFDGDGLPEATEGSELVYQKYALPEVAPQENTIRLSAHVSPGEAATMPPSLDAQKDPRRLRVGHTMVGMASAITPEVLAAADAQAGRVPSNPPIAAYSPMDEPVDLPTTGFPPSAVGFMVLFAMAAAAIAGFLLLR